MRLVGGLACLPALGAGAACSVSTTGMAFGSYDPLSAVALDSAATVTVACDVLAVYAVASSSGGGGFQDRQMSAPGQLLHYNLYVDLTRLIVWGDGSLGTARLPGTNVLGRHTVYGRIPARQNVGGGVYSDNITVTVTY